MCSLSGHIGLPYHIDYERGYTKRVLYFLVFFNLFPMALRMQTLVHSQGQERTHVCLKYIKALVTIVMGGVDVDVGLLVNLRRFIEDHCFAGLCSVERGGALTHKHFQMMVKGNFTSLLVLNKKTKVCLGWDASPLMGRVVSCKKLTDEGLQILKAMIEYYMKDNGEEHFEFVHHNVLVEDMNDGKMEYVKFGKMDLNNQLSVSHNNIM